MRGVDELRDLWRRSEVSDSLRFHDVFYGVFILNEGDDPHLSFALGALERIDFVYAFYARGPNAPSKLLPIVALLFFS